MPSDKIIAFARAISRAEGFNLPGTVPTLAHNPGDLKIPGWTGPKLGIEGISVFVTDEEGWERLYRELELIASGKSHVYQPDWSILDMAHHWTDTLQTEWAANVALVLGVPYTAKLGPLLTD